MPQLQKKLRAARYLLTAIIPLVIIIGSFGILAFNKEFYYDNIGSEGTRETASEIVDYLRTGDAITPELSARETEHMKDVRPLVKAFFIALYTLTAIAIILLAYLYRKNKAGMFKAIYSSGIATLILIALLLILAYFSFGETFITFHKILFRNDLWLLPADSTLIKTFTENFFISFLKRILLYSTIASLALIAIGWKK